MEEFQTVNFSNFLHQKNEDNTNDKSESIDLEKFAMEAFKVFAEATKSANNLPFGKSRDLYESCPAFHRILRLQEQEVLSNLSAIIKQTEVKGNIQKRDDEDKFEMIVDLNDVLLEKVSICLDEISGIRKTSEPDLVVKKPEFLSGSWNRGITDLQKCTQILNAVASKTKNMEKPQLKFKDKINNDGAIPFEPRIKYKYNLLKPLSIIACENSSGLCQFTHPYEFELSKFKPSKTQLVHQEPKPFKTLSQTPMKLIENKEDVSLLVEDLQKYAEIAVDLEHHSYRSFQGFTCLLQISTRNADYIIDAISLRSELEELNKVFTDPSIVKVFHGADSDILWLQKDLSLYVVNMFDTYQAAKLLKYPRLSLSYLLKYYCNVNAQKCFQLADWRIRPLPEDFISYAREDTHYLLYIYDHLRNKLIEKGNGQTNMLESVIHESSRICLQTYQKPVFDKDGYLDIYHRSKKLFDNRQKSALRRLFEWRDKTARELDESLGYVLPNHMMLNISEILPREAQGILACCNPIPQPVRQNLLHLHQLVLKAREEPLIKPVLEEQGLHRHTSSINFSDNSLFCPHDLNHEDFRDDLPVLLSGNSDTHLNSSVSDIIKKISNKPIIDVFEKLWTPSCYISKVSRSNAYSRYKLAKKYFESIEMQNYNINKDAKSKDDVEKETKANHASTDVQSNGSKTNQNLDDTKSGCESHEKESMNMDYKIISEVSRKRKSNEDSGILSKTFKMENKIDAVDNRNDTCINPEDKSKKFRKKKKGKHKKQETHFIPYNYESANFDKYKAFNMPPKKKFHKNNRRRGKKSVKNLKISV